MRRYLYIFLILYQGIVAQNAHKSSLNYHNRNCTGGVGFCSNDDNFSEKELDAKFCNKILNKLIMTIPKNKLSSQELHEFTIKNYFSVSGFKSFILPTAIHTKSTNNIKYSKIEIGNYPIKIEEDSIKIYFDIVEIK